MKLKTTLALTLLALSSAPALAAGNFYVLGAGGTTHANVNQSEIDADLRNAGLTLLSSSVDNNDVGYKLQVGYQFNPNFAIEGGYVNLGKFGYSASLTGGSGGGDAKVDGWNIGLLGTLPLANNFGVFAKLGTIDAKVKTRIYAVGTGGSGSIDESSTKWKTNLGLGGTWMVSKNLGVRLEYEEFWKLGDKDTTGESDVSMLSIGLSYHF
ncbi:MAG: hypothetical protein RIR70_1488 [Pseudomonadota bacterium]|jgi:OOP family OmpA-OmpF porin